MELRIHGISKTYANGVQALKDVTLTIPAGMYGLLGPNGAGKSTLMRMIATLQDPDTGTIILGDIDVVRQKDEVRKTLGYLPDRVARHCVLGLRFGDAIGSRWVVSGALQVVVERPERRTVPQRGGRVLGHARLDSLRERSDTLEVLLVLGRC